MRDSHENIQKQVLDEKIFTKQRGRMFDLVRTWLTDLTEACRNVYFDSAHPIYLETICVHMDVAQI